MTKAYQIYGMGDALVDFSIETNPQELIKLKIDKGVRTLIDAARKNELFAAFENNPVSRMCGGSSANTIVVAQSLGSKCFYSCKVANDETGLFFRDNLLRHGIDNNLSDQALLNGQSGLCLVLVTEDADRTMNTFLGVSGNIDYKQINEKALLNSSFFYLEGYVSSSPIGLATAIKTKKLAQKNNVKVAFSLSDLNMVKFFRQGLDDILCDGIDVLFCNFDEAILYSQKNTIEAAAKKLLQVCKVLVITLGAKGSLIATQKETITVSALTVDAIDTNGAGDLFAGCFLHAYIKGLSLHKCAELASFAAAQLVTQLGPRLTRENVEKVKIFANNLGS